MRKISGGEIYLLHSINLVLDGTMEESLHEVTRIVREVYAPCMKDYWGSPNKTEEQILAARVHIRGHEMLTSITRAFNANAEKAAEIFYYKGKLSPLHRKWVRWAIVEYLTGEPQHKSIDELMGGGGGA